MQRNPWLTMVLGLLVGLVLGYVLAERQTVPPAKALRLGVGTAAQAQGASLPEGHPPVDAASPAASQRLRQQVAEIEGLLAANPNDVGLMAAMGNVFFDAESWPEAREWYEKSLAASPGDPNVMTDLAVVHRNLGQPQRAIELLDEVLAIEPEHWQAVFNKVIIFQFDVHDHDQAATALRSLQELKRTNPAIPDLSGLEKEVFGG
jgi:tetratricopeptide (TPR) repeat protein